MDEDKSYEMFWDLRQELLDFQGGGCGICGCDNGPYGLVVDHDHDSGLVRGLLCTGCNTREGKHRDCNDWETCPICYWRHVPAVAKLGWTTSYWSTFGYAKCGAPVGKWEPTEYLAFGSWRQREQMAADYAKYMVPLVAE